MPINFWITRCSIPELGVEIKKKTGLFGLSFGVPEMSHYFTKDEFDETLAGLPSIEAPSCDNWIKVQRRRDDLYWMWHEPEDLPICAAQWTQLESDPGKGYITLSVSYSHYRFPFALGATMEWGYKAAAALGAYFAEEPGCEVINKRNEAYYFNATGPFASMQRRFWEETQLEHRLAGAGLLEIPVGPADYVPQYFRFEIDPANNLTTSELVERLDLKAANKVGGDGPLILTEKNLSVASVVRQVESGKLIVCRLETEVPFKHSAPFVLKLVDKIQALTCGKVTFLGEPITDELRSKIEACSNGLAVEFMLNC